ncbi:hypothetical protein NQ314_017523 [Rhamnusium bicolor]|uniref:PiggyBac transposable element-derived protein domain-containing protein n=1 Tax=Rhamnusium bicolor TaxID=1586634 RepID=A0AAV8WTD4_9CUCU|nr:hypothetical protein NQ314_017523 [Rhamnusium bicolor]
MASFETEQEQLQKLLEEVLCDEDGETQYDDQSDDDVSDRKDNVTYRKNHALVIKAVKTRSENLIKRLPGSSIATRFDNKDTRMERIAFDKLAAIRAIFDIYATNCKNGYCLPDYLTIDEMFAGFTGKCNFRQYIPSKPNNLHHSDDIDNETEDLQKPQIVTECNKTKGDADVVDKLVSSYDCARNLRRWPMVILYTMLNVAGIKAQVIFTSNNPETKIL